MNQIYQVIKNGIMKKRNKTITLNELYSIAKGSNMISSVDLSDPEGIQVFQNAVNELIGDAIIESIGKSQNSFFELPGKFKILICPTVSKHFYVLKTESFKNFFNHLLYFLLVYAINLNILFLLSFIIN